MKPSQPAAAPPLAGRRAPGPPERPRPAGGRPRWRPSGPVTQLRSWLHFEGERPSAATIWVLAYAALFLVRPWEELLPPLEALRLETVGIVLLLLRITIGSDARLDARAAAPILLLVGAMSVAGVASLDLGLSYHELEQVVRVALFAVCAIAALRTPADVRAFCFGWVAIMFAYEAKALWEYIVHGRGAMRMGIWRLIGIEKSHGDPNTFAGKVVLLFPIVAALLVTARHQLEKRFFLFCFVQGGIVVVLTGSRGAFLCAVFLILLYVLASERRAQMLGVGALLALLAVLFLPPEIKERYQTIFDSELNESATESAEGRWIGLRKGVDLFRMRPLVGVGPGVFPNSSDYVPRLPYEIVGLRSHNLVGQVLGEHGLVGALGFAAFLVLVATSVFTLLRIPPAEDPTVRFMRSLGRGLGFVVLVLLFQGLGSHNFRSYNWLWIAAIAGAAVVASRQAGVLPGPPRGRPRRSAPATRPRSSARSSEDSVQAAQSPT